MAQDFLTALLRSIDGAENTGVKSPIQVHVIDENSMSPELSQLLATSGAGGNARQERTIPKATPCEKEGTASNPSTEPSILITSHGRQYTSLKKFLADEGCKDISKFLDVWKITDDFVQALNSCLVVDFINISVTVFNNTFSSYREACQCFHLSEEDVKSRLDTKFRPLGQSSVTSEALSKELGRVIFEMCQGS